MIILKRKHIAKDIADNFIIELKKKSIIKNDSIKWMSPISMTDNEFDFFMHSKNQELSITRIKRLNIMLFLPKILVTVKNLENRLTYEMKLGPMTFIICLFAIFAYLLNVYYFIAFGDNSLEELLYAALAIISYFGLIYLDTKIVESKFKNNFNKIIP